MPIVYGVLAALAITGAVLIATSLYRSVTQTDLTEAYLPQLEARARTQPYDPALHGILAARYMQAHDYAAAHAAISVSIGAGDNTGVNWCALAATSAASGNINVALGDLKLGLQKSDGSPTVAEAIQRANAIPNQSPETLAPAIAPDGPAPLLNEYARGTYLDPWVDRWQSKHPDQSGFATRERWIRARPTDPQNMVLWGDALRKNRRFDEAQSVLAQALDVVPSSANAHLAMAQTLVDSGDVSNAIPQFVDALHDRRNWVPALLGLGSSALIRHLKFAQLAYERAAQLEPENVDAEIGVGSSCIVLETNAAEAVRAFGIAQRLDRTRTDYFDYYADAFVQIRKPDEAEAILRKRIAAAPADALAHYKLASILLNTRPTPSRIAEAQSQADIALQLQPNNPLVEVQLGKLLELNGRYAEEAAILAKAVSVWPANVPTLHLLAGAYGRLGQLKKSQEIEQRADLYYKIQSAIAIDETKAQLTPGSSAVREELRQLYLRNGDQGKARSATRMLQLFKVDPTGTGQKLKEANDDVLKAIG